ncbi:efflux RND transporter periplasmic adaptor subunit [Methylotenera sp.]|uniref:efflux RND transporter periplasmic adaptor subunit n=1 Tax=Methylotenera sp. TaxID=2051956 RepID=UPI002721B246|nr:efflux RND transporter periplasmic adaptor subunit [Methylotenera sp.]MDO9392512.1 efflux RND transporter periplasmic adaptor subunit [Methylotenera sp.]MDP2070234.1 efflux RND transporter periplasmic adaptor subunit [Methylotenera sp.]MDP2231927.1 efflux RND transporter periplasmic adaptor subunit [Methylotenera sp.]MDP3007404.1 efflux RND transporter periplasmic adaptor subunit [Methylotenera sp.]MDP3141026.1 efflux RND transporter periplasmic adaptor subunit [Methylotenera sp.]
MMNINKLVLFCMAALMLSSCNKPKEVEVKTASNLPLVSIAKVHTQSIEITEEAVGTLEGLIDPTVTAEVTARVIKVYVGVGQTVKKGELIALLDASDFGLQSQEAQAEVNRIEVLLANQKKMVERNQALVNKNFISKNALDDATAQQNALKQQLQAAKIRVASAASTSAKTRIFAPADGKIEKKIVDSGEFVRIGDPIVQIIGNQKLRAHIPFPESIAPKIKPGLEIKLSTPISGTTVTTTVKEIKPLVMADNRSIDVIADISNQPDWQAGASVNAQLILSKKEGVLMVPEQSVVLRPAGEVVYVIQNNIAQQRIIQTGERQSGWVEILNGLEPGLEVAVDGAAYLTDNAKVKIAQTKVVTGKPNAASNQQANP